MKLYTTLFGVAGCIFASLVSCHKDPINATMTMDEASLSNKITETSRQTKTNNNVRFICASGYDRDSDKHYPTTYAWTSRGKIAIVRWKSEWFESSQWNPQSRCEVVSPRFQQAYNNGSMNFFTYSWQNNQKVVCTAYQKGGDCVTMLFTLRPEDDPVETIADLTDILNGRSTSPAQHSSGEQRVYFKIVNIDRFLQKAPVEKD
ncbi:MAG: COP23 domain-containing protein [Prochloraceae cyanobacterium]|nr:COP23 domain-containing protein [Prochloraceae cyanobacterium]